LVGFLALAWQCMAGVSVLLGEALLGSWTAPLNSIAMSHEILVSCSISAAASAAALPHAAPFTAWNLSLGGLLGIWKRRHKHCLCPAALTTADVVVMLRVLDFVFIPNERHSDTLYHSSSRVSDFVFVC